MRVTTYGLTVILIALTSLIAAVGILLVDNNKLNDAVDDQSLTIKTIMKKYERDNRCKG